MYKYGKTEIKMSLFADDIITFKNLQISYQN